MTPILAQAQKEPIIPIEATVSHEDYKDLTVGDMDGLSPVTETVKNPPRTYAQVLTSPSHPNVSSGGNRGKSPSV